MRPFRLCGICGARVSSTSATLEDPIAYCHEHAELVRDAEALPPEPLEQAPTMAAELRTAIRTQSEHVKHTGPGVKGAGPGAAGSPEVELERWRVVDRWWTDGLDEYEYRELEAAGRGRRVERRRPGGDWLPCG